MNLIKLNVLLNLVFNFKMKLLHDTRYVNDSSSVSVCLDDCNKISMTINRQRVSIESVLLFR